MLYTTLMGATICRYAGRLLATLRHYCIGQTAISQQRRDYALPNPTWSRTTLELYDKYMRLSEGGAWRRLPSYRTSAHYLGKEMKPGVGEARLFSRNLDQDGVGFEYSMFHNKDEKRTVCIFQPGPYLEGPPGYTHGGCLATMIDSIVWSAAVYSCGHIVTASLTIRYRNPVPLGSTVVIDGWVDKIEGRKVYTICQIRSPDEEVMHAEATCLLIKLAAKKGESAESAEQEKQPLEGSRL